MRKLREAGIKNEAYARILPHEGSALIKAKQNLHDAEREARVKRLCAYPTARAQAFAKWGEKAENGSEAWLTAPKARPQYNKTKKGTITVRIQAVHRVMVDFISFRHFFAYWSSIQNKACNQRTTAEAPGYSAALSTLGILLWSLARVRLEGFDEMRYIRKSDGGGKGCG